MATTKQYELLFMLKAQMDSAFGTGFTTAKTYVSELQGKINEYKHSLSDISAYQKHQQALTTLNTKLKAEQQALEETRTKIKANGGATEELSKEEKTHSDNINKLNEQIAKKKAALDQVKESLDKSKISTDDLAAAEEDLKAKIEETTQTSEDFAKLDNEVTSLANAFSVLKPAADLAYNAVKTLASGLMDCVNTAGDLEYTISGVEATTGATEDEVNQLTEVAKYMGATTAYTAQECADALQTQALAGWSVEEMISGLPAVVQLAAASQEDLNTMTSIVSDSLNAFGLSGSDAVNRFADVLTQASASSNVEVADLGESLSYVESTAANLGYSIEDVSIALSVMGNQALKGSVSGSALNTMLTRMSGANSNAENEMERLGLSMYDASGQAKDLMTFMNELRDAFQNSGMSAQEMQNSAYKLAGQRGMRGLLSIVNTSEEEWEEMTEDIYNCAGAAETMTNIQLDNYKGQVYLLTSAWDALKTTIGEGLLPTATAAAEVLTDVTTAVNDFAQSNQELVVPLSAAALAFGGVAGVVGTLGTALQFAKFALASFAPALAGVGAAAVGIGAVVALGAALVTASLSIDRTSEETDKLKESSDSLIESVQSSRDSYNETVSSYEEEKNNISGLIDTIDTLTSSGNDDALTQMRIQDAVDSLNEALPDLNLEYDSLNGTLSMTTEQMEKFADASGYSDTDDKLARLTELQSQQSNLESEIAVNKAALEEANNQYAAELADGSNFEASHFGASDQIANIKTYQQAVNDLTSEYDTNQEEIDALIAELGDYTTAQEDAADATGLTETQLEEITDAATAYGEAWQAAYEDIQKSMSEGFDPFGDVDEWESTDLGDIQSNLETQKKRYEQYKEDIQTILNSGIDVSGLVDSISDGSTESMSYAKALADDITNNGGEAVKSIAEDTQSIQTTINEASGGLADMTSDVQSARQALADALTIDDESLKASAVEAAQGVLEGYTEGLGGDYTAISNSTTSMGDITISSLKTALDEHSPSAKAEAAGVGVGTGLNKGIASMHASTGNAMYKYGSYAMARAINGINSKKAGLVEAARSAGNAAAEAFKSATSSISTSGYATGTTYAAPGWALVGEEGPELLKSTNGAYSIVGANGPQMVPMEGGETVYTASETQSLLSNSGGVYQGQSAYQGSAGAVQQSSAAPKAVQSEQSSGGSGSPAIQVTYAPQITITGNADADKLKEVLSAHNQELLDLIETYLTEREASQRRRAY